MMEGNISDSDSQMPNESNSTTSMIVGTTALELVLPAVIIALMELLDQIDMGAEFKWIIYSIIFSVTIISILAISGAHITGLLPAALRIPSGVYLMALSGLNLLVRFNNFNDVQPYYATSWFEFMQWPQTHEQLELSFLGLLIGALIMKK